LTATFFPSKIAALCTPMRDHYRILGIRPDATQEEIKEAWSFSVKAFHPDKFAGSSQRQQTVAGERTKAINEAYEVLSDAIKRASYDREYAREPRTHSAAQLPPPPPPPCPTPPPPRPTPPPRPASPPQPPPQGVSKRVKRTLLILSVGLLLLIGGAAYYFQKSNDVVGRGMDDLVQEFTAANNGMMGQLRALDEREVLAPDVLSNKTILEAEARKRIEAQRIIEKFRNDLPYALDAVRQKAASYNISDEQKQALMSGFEKARPHLSLQIETICNLWEKRERSELDFLHFMASAYNKYELKDGKVFFRSATSGQRYSEFVKSFENSDKEIDAARKEWLNIKTNIRKLSQ
jgi:curved DNA-binding protein CbpA